MGATATDVETGFRRVYECEFCGSPTLQRLMFIKGASKIWRCDSCKAGATEVLDFNPTAYYTLDYFDGGRSDGYADYAGSETVLKREFASTARRLSRLLPEGGRLLEVGSAFGYFLEVASRWFEVHGVEISVQAAAEARKRGLKVHTGVLTPELVANLGRLDAVVLLDVIEHLDSPFGVLSLATRQLASGGKVLLTTGDFFSPVARLMGRSWRLMTPPQHLWFLTPEAARRLMERIGLRVISVRHPWKQVPLSLVLFQSSRLLGLQPRRWPLVPARLGIPINLFDAMEIIAEKP